MAAGASREIANALVAAGKPASTPVALVESASLEGETRFATTLEELQSRDLPRAEGPVVMCIGEVFRDARAVESILQQPHVRMA
jgi:uroporphyrin-III C-methyltransferase